MNAFVHWLVVLGVTSEIGDGVYQWFHVEAIKCSGHKY